VQDEIKKIILQKVISVCTGMADSQPDDDEKYWVFPKCFIIEYAEGKMTKNITSNQRMFCLFGDTKMGNFPSNGFLTSNSIFVFCQLVCSLPYFFD
jgi:hypothetical protein